MKKIALITGITGQDGSYLAEFLLKKNYVVHGLIRKSSTFNTKRIDHIYIDPHNKTNFFLHYGDLTDTNSIYNLIHRIRPNEIYNLGAQSHVGVSFENPEYTSEVSGIGTLRLLEAIRFLKIKILNFTKLAPQNFLEKHMEKISLTKNQNFIQNHHMGLLNCIHIGSHLFIESRMEFLHAMEFYLIMKAQGEVKLCYKKNNKIFSKKKIRK